MIRDVLQERKKPTETETVVLLHGNCQKHPLLFLLKGARAEFTGLFDEPSSLLNGSSTLETFPEQPSSPEAPWLAPTLTRLPTLLPKGLCHTWAEAQRAGEDYCLAAGYIISVKR